MCIHFSERESGTRAIVKGLRDKWILLICLQTKMGERSFLPCSATIIIFPPWWFYAKDVAAKYGELFCGGTKFNFSCVLRERFHQSYLAQSSALMFIEKALNLFDVPLVYVSPLNEAGHFSWMVGSVKQD